MNSTFNPDEISVNEGEEGEETEEREKSSREEEPSSKDPAEIKGFRLPMRYVPLTEIGQRYWKM